MHIKSCAYLRLVCCRLICADSTRVTWKTLAVGDARQLVYTMARSMGPLLAVFRLILDGHLAGGGRAGAHSLSDALVQVDKRVRRGEHDARADDVHRRRDDAAARLQSTATDGREQAGVDACEVMQARDSIDPHITI